MSSYSRYKKQNYKYIVSDKSTYYTKYVRLSISYNINYLLSKSNQVAINYQVEKLQEQEEEAIVKILRLYKQQKLLRQCRRDILRRGLQTLDKLDTQERKEKEEVEERVRQEEAERLLARSTKDPYPDYDPTLLARLATLPADDPLQLSDFNPYALPMGYDSYSTLDSVLVVLGSNSGTPPASQGS